MTRIRLKVRMKSFRRMKTSSTLMRRRKTKTGRNRMCNILLLK